MTDLLSIKRQKKKQNPRFIRQDAHKKSRLAKNWRKPRGIQSKMRLHLAGHRPIVHPGFGTPASLRGATRDGMFPMIVFNVSDLNKLDVKKNSVIIGSSVGKRKKVEIIKKAEESKFKILNVKNPEQYVKDVQAQVATKKKAAVDRKKLKEEKQKELEKKAEEKEKKEKKEKADKEQEEKKEGKEATLDETLEEEKADKEKEDKKKVLTKKDTQM